MHLVAQVESNNTAIAIPTGKAKPKAEGFDLKKSKIILTAKHFEAYNQLQKSRIIHAVFSAIWSGKLMAHATPLLNEKLTWQEFQNLSAKKRKAQIQNPNNPDDIYDLIDTVITPFATPWQALGFEVDYSKDVFTEVFSDTQKAYFKIDDIKTVISNEQVAFLNSIKKYSIKAITDSSLVLISDSLFHQTASLLYHIGTSGKETAYSSLFFDQEISVERIKNIGQHYFQTSIPNPNNPEDIYDLIDTVIRVSFHDTLPKHIKVFYTWEEIEDYQYKIKPYAFAPMYLPAIGDTKLKPINIFLLMANGVEQNCTKELYTYLNYLSIAVLRDKGTDKVNETALFQDLE